MPGISEVGADKVELESYKCSIEKVTVSTKWKAPLKEISETVEALAYDNVEAKEGKTLYLISNPEGKTVIIKTEKKDGKCSRSNHKNYLMKWDDYKEQKCTAETVSQDRTKSHFNSSGLLTAAVKDVQMSALYGLPFVLPINLVKTPLKVDEKIKGESIVKIKCFEIGGVLDALSYWYLPLDLEKKYITQFNYTTCKEGFFGYKIISYPDINFKLKISIGTKEKSEAEISTEKDASDGGFVLPYKKSKPKFEATTKFNGGNNELTIKVDFNTGDKVKENFSCTYIKNDRVLTEISSEALQQIKSIKAPLDFIRALIKICSLEFINDFLAFDVNTIPKDKRHKVVDFDPKLPNATFSIEGKYCTSRDLTQVGKCFLLEAACDPLIGCKITIDLLYLILNWTSAGAATGIYVLIKNLKEVLKSMFDNKYDELPVDGDVFFDLEITGCINARLKLVIDTIKDNDKHHSLKAEGVISVDLKAGIKASIQVFYFVSGAIEFSAEASSGIKVVAELDYRGLKEGLYVPLNVIFNGIKIKYKAKAYAGLKKVKYNNKGGVGFDIDGEKELLGKKSLYTREFGPYLKP